MRKSEERERVERKVKSAPTFVVTRLTTLLSLFSEEVRDKHSMG